MKFGEEVWCNLEGQYTTIVADFNDLVVGTKFNVNICSLGVMGTKYVRSAEITKSLKVEQNETKVLEIP